MCKLGTHNHPCTCLCPTACTFNLLRPSSHSLQGAFGGLAISDMHRTFSRLTHCSSRSAFVPLNSRQVVASGTARAAGSQSGLPHSVGSEKPVSNVSKSHKATLYTSNRAGSGQGFQPGPSSKQIRGQAASASVVASAASMTEVHRDFDVVVWGATGFVGRLICERLARKYQVRSCTSQPASGSTRFHGHAKVDALVTACGCCAEADKNSICRVDCSVNRCSSSQGEVKWAMAGRNKEKLEGVRETAAAANGAAKVCCLQMKPSETLRSVPGCSPGAAFNARAIDARAPWAVRLVPVQDSPSPAGTQLARDHH